MNKNYKIAVVGTEITEKICRKMQGRFKSKGKLQIVTGVGTGGLL